jgi:hypothetical protein
MLQKDIEEILNAHDTGARVCKTDNSQFIVYDCPEWGQQLENKLLGKYPQMTISIQSSNKSLSGFILLLSVNNIQHEMTWATIVGLLLAMNYFFYKECVYHTIALFT